MSRFLVTIKILLGCGLLSVAAHASVLYKCSTKDGSIAYVGSQKGYSNCKLLGHFADPLPAGSAPAASESHHWVYKESAKPDHEPVAAGDDRRRVDFSTIKGGVESTAPMLKGAMLNGASVGDRGGVTAAPKLQTASVAARAAPKVLRGAVYRVAGANNVTEYTNVKPVGGAFTVLFTYIATCFACDIHSKIDFARTALNLGAYKDAIASAASDYGVDSAWLHAVIHAESAFNPLAISAKGAQGLMQLMPGTAGDLGVTDAFDAVQNIRGGARYLAELLKDFNGDSQLATAAYNAGPAAVQKYGGVPPYDETRLYVQRVAELRDRYKKAL